MAHPPIVDYRQPEPISKQRPRRRRQLFVALGLAAAVCIVLVVGFFWIASQLTLGTDTEALSQPQIESIIGCKLPPTATAVRAHFTRWQDSNLELRFTAPPDEVERFVAATLIRRPLSKTTISETVETAGTSWWTPGQPSRFESGYSDQTDSLVATEPSTAPATEPNVHHAILIDESNPNAYVVWFVSFQS